VAKRLTEAGHPAQRLVLVGTAAGFVEGTRQYDTEAVPHDTIVIHGSKDETVPLANVSTGRCRSTCRSSSCPAPTTSSTVACT
jgi:alpha/beta superfamily hydrolase